MGGFPPGNIDHMRHPGGESSKNLALFDRVNAEKFEQETRVHHHHPRQSIIVNTQVLVVRGSNPGHAKFPELIDEVLKFAAVAEVFGEALGCVEFVFLHLVELRAPVMESGSESIRILGTLKMVAGVSSSSSNSWMNDSLIWIIHRVSSGLEAMDAGNIDMFAAIVFWEYLLPIQRR
nr:hypothetical protein Iba_chr03fCG1290 [Ipomoea batatas]GME10227.1 hypothetical protein Iba_scaffold9750CG0020 [Ipomoea batatas]